ncbi:DUF4399 domain-containing protein [Euzebya rosea]|uniref:DUF4399 domain-containing protein n=1 Tax=Euzebya rosea TaxID=2052804 RepID=UPI00196AAC67|nr:DUF4399 domain-containing protein [Euzebya rosea]
MKYSALALVLVMALAACSSGDDEASSIAFGGVADGDTVSSPVTVDFETTGDFTVEEAGEVNDNAGHMHVMVDVDCVAVGETIPGDDNHIHFGDGSTSAELELEPGEHTLCLQAGDGEHTALDLTDEITITVE